MLEIRFVIRPRRQQHHARVAACGAVRNEACDQRFVAIGELVDFQRTERIRKKSRHDHAILQRITQP